MISLQNHAYSKILKFSPPKTGSFLIFFIFLLIDYPQSMYLSRNKKNNVYPCKPQFYFMKWGLRGSKLYRYVFVMVLHFQGTLLFCCVWLFWHSDMNMTRLSESQHMLSCSDIVTWFCKFIRLSEFQHVFSCSDILVWILYIVSTLRISTYILVIYILDRVYGEVHMLTLSVPCLRLVVFRCPIFRQGTDNVLMLGRYFSLCVPQANMMRLSGFESNAALNNCFPINKKKREGNLHG